MKKSTITFLLFFYVMQGYSQASPHFSVNGQLLGNSYLGGFNIQKDFVIDKYSHVSVAMGVGHTQNFIFTNHLTISTGKGKNYLEAGFAASFINFRTNDNFVQRGYLILPLIGYKHISSEGYIARLHFTPVVQDSKFFVYGGASLGIYFRKNKKENPTISTVRFSND